MGIIENIKGAYGAVKGLLGDLISAQAKAADEFVAGKIAGVMATEVPGAIIDASGKGPEGGKLIADIIARAAKSKGLLAEGATANGPKFTRRIEDMIKTVGENTFLAPGPGTEQMITEIVNNVSSYSPFQHAASGVAGMFRGGLNSRIANWAIVGGGIGGIYGAVTDPEGNRIRSGVGGAFRGMVAGTALGGLYGAIGGSMLELSKITPNKVAAAGREASMENFKSNINRMFKGV